MTYRQRQRRKWVNFQFIGGLEAEQLRPGCSAGADFEYQGADERGAADDDCERDGEVAVGVAHVGLDSGGEAVGDHADDAEEQAEAHASAGEEEGGEEHAHGGEEKQRETAPRSRRGASSITL